MPKASYTVTASNGTGSTNAAVSIQVDAIAPSVAYPSNSITLTTGAAANIAPSSTGGPVASWSITPVLPAGLTFDTTTGRIAGSATSTYRAASFVVTAVNTGGKSQVALSIQVVSTVLLDLGHPTSITHLVVSGTRGLSNDTVYPGYYAGRCILSNITTDTMVASAQCDYKVLLETRMGRYFFHDGIMESGDISERALFIHRRDRSVLFLVDHAT